MNNNKEYTYGQFMAVARQLRRYENLLNNCEQFKEQFNITFPENFKDVFIPIEEPIIKAVARYRAIYQNMLKTIK